MKKSCYIENLGVMVDCSRNSVLLPETIKRLIDYLSIMGYKTLQLYTEDTYEVDNEPYFGYLRGRYSKDELKDLDAYALKHGIELIPCIQTLAHLNQIFRWTPYKNIRDCDDILLIGEERVYELIENMFRSISECFSSRRVNIGMDEAHMVGRGKYFDINGNRKRSEIMAEHLTKVNAIAHKYGFRCMMWSDMFFRLAFGGEYYVANGKIPDCVREIIPSDITLIYWDYYSSEKEHYDQMLLQHSKFDRDIIFAGGASTWYGLAPMNGYALATIKAAIESCYQNRINEIFITMWGDNGGSCSPFSALPVLYTAAEYAKGNFDDLSIKAGFEKMFGIPFDTFMYADLPNQLCERRNIERFNPSKYMLYNDCLLGQFDSGINIGAGDIYAGHIDLLKKAEKYQDWEFLFKPLRLMCEILYYKADLGVRTRKAYKEKNRQKIKTLIRKRYEPLLEKIEEFYASFLVYWERLYKPHGFDVMDYRIGGVRQRVAHCIKTLTDYTEGKIVTIAELDEEIIDYLGGGDNCEKRMFIFNNFPQNATVNIL